MKKLFVLMAILALALAACGDKDTSDDGNNGNNNNSGNTSGTTLTIKNTSDYDFKKVEYNMTSFGAIDSGKTQNKGVSANASKPVTFVLDHAGPELKCQTSAFSCDAGQNREITIDNDTTVTTTDYGTDTLENVAYMMETASGKH